MGGWLARLQQKVYSDHKEVAHLRQGQGGPDPRNGLGPLSDRGCAGRAVQILEGDSLDSKWTCEAMMNFCSNSEGQRDPKLNEYQQVADRVRGAGRCDCQEIGKHGSNKPIQNGDGDDIFISPTPSNSNNLSTKDLLARPVQDPDLNSHEMSASLPRSLIYGTRTRSIKLRCPQSL
ncbi:unnamed protein product [Sphagnum balticum]